MSDQLRDALGSAVKAAAKVIERPRPAAEPAEVDSAERTPAVREGGKSK